MGMYYLGFLLGRFLISSAIGGIIPMIISLRKKRWGVGAVAMIFCGVGGCIQPIISLITGVFFIIVACIVESHREFEDSSYEENPFQYSTSTENTSTSSTTDVPTINASQTLDPLNAQSAARNDDNSWDCPNCGTNNRATRVLCYNCGTKIK